MTCHNGATPGQGMYSGPGLENPHPFGSAAYLDCTTCHGGNALGQGRQGSHVPTPPEIGDDNRLANDAVAYFNYLNGSGVDKYADYTVDGTTFSPLDWIQFRNPGDMRIVSQGRGCGATGCHGDDHAKWFSTAPINTEMGFYSATMFTTGSESFTGNDDWFNTSADLGFRAKVDNTFVYNPTEVGRVAQIIEFPEYAQYGRNGGNYIYENPDYNAAALNNDVHNGTLAEANRVFSGSNLERLVMEVVALNCGDCHAGSNGANNRYADFRSSGCSACHMQYSKDGISRSRDPNVPKDEPANPDAIAAPERPHVASHQIRNVAKFIQGGFVRGIDDVACVGCHQGSNRTVLQFWGIRLDQNQDVVNGFQYPANPVTFQTTAQDSRLYDPSVANATFNGRVPEQYLLFEDYDGDGRDDTPSDIHYEAGMGCIDCHGTADLHGGATVGPTSASGPTRTKFVGTCSARAATADIDDLRRPPSRAWSTKGGAPSAPPTATGRPLRHVTRDANGHFWLRSKLSGQYAVCAAHPRRGARRPLAREPAHRRAAVQPARVLRDGPDRRRRQQRRGPAPTEPEPLRSGLRPPGLGRLRHLPRGLVEHLRRVPPGAGLQRRPGQLLLLEHHRRTHRARFRGRLHLPEPGDVRARGGSHRSHHPPATRHVHVLPVHRPQRRHVPRLRVLGPRGRRQRPRDVAGRGLGALAHNRMMPHSVRGARSTRTTRARATAMPATSPPTWISTRTPRSRPLTQTVTTRVWTTRCSRR
jgi:hypothetical protein